jgi:hypothetical protein
MTTVGFPLYSEGPRQNLRVLVETFPGRETPKRHTAKRGNEMNDFDSVGDYAVPVDPMDDLQCESCQ